MKNVVMPVYSIIMQ